jgi:hypothetical protein
MSSSGRESQEPTNGAAICTLFEGDYHLGLAAFVNSLVRAGYKGTIWAGYRGALPPWISQLERVQSDRMDEFQAADEVRIVFLKLTTGIHLTNYKPEFMLNLLENECQGCKYLWYFDPDIFLMASWNYFRTWQGHGIALCQEVVDNILPSDAPLRKEWMKLAAGIGFQDPRPVNQYHNAGMVGIPAEHKEFLEEWRRFISLAESLGYDLGYLAHGSREMPFNISDQDALNIAIMYTKAPLSTLGPQGMGFVFGASMVMYHAVGQKPWRGSFLLRAMKGNPPSGAMKFFMTQVEAPIRAYAPMQLRAKRLACSMAAFIGRFYRRS